MVKRAEYLKESPCYSCPEALECVAKVARQRELMEIVDYVMPRAGYDYHKCTLYETLNGERQRRTKSAKANNK